MANLNRFTAEWATKTGKSAHCVFDCSHVVSVERGVYKMIASLLVLVSWLNR